MCLKPQVRGDPPVAVSPPMFQHHILDSGLEVDLFLGRPSSSQVAIKSSSAHLRQLAHSLDTQTTLQRHPRSYFGVDASSPEFCFCRRRALAFCKAGLKKSTSRVLFAKSRFSFVICFRISILGSAEVEDLSHPIEHASCRATGDIYQVPARA
jgi:hypothetical protein